MTDKRFRLNSVLNFDFGICDYGEPIGSLRNICELLNEQHETIQRLKENIDELLSVNVEEDLLKENMVLKEQMQRLYNYFYDWHSDEMEGNQFSEMWDNVKEDKKWE